MSAPLFASFWQGQLSPFESACLASIARRGHPVTLYSYEPLAGLPEGVAAADAAEIVPRSAIGRFRYGGKPNLSHFSDYFRYKLFALTDAIWIDADVFLIRDIDEALPPTLLARERQPIICGAVLRIEKGDELDEVIAATEAAMDRELNWGETGPRLLSKVFGQDALLRRATPAERFFSLDHDEIWKVFLPAYRDECEAKTERSWGVHLFNNVVDRLGVWKRLAPPPGSFLHERWRLDGSLGVFSDSYPAVVMERMIENWRLRQSGDDLGVKQVARQLLPSVGRTVRHYAGPGLSLSAGVQNLRTRFSNA